MPWVVLALVLTAAAGYTSATPMDEKARLEADLEAIEELHQRDVAATWAFDVEALVSLWTDDIVALPPGGAPVIGKEANRALLEAARAQSADFEPIDYNQKWEEVRVVGDFAYEWGLFKTAVRSRTTGQVIRQRYKVVRVLQRQPDGSWLVHRTIWNDAPPEQPTS
ncbi:MAG: DUF4440 domain-containing protein [Acidobacteria bacterium]|nr:DUF4440 domain-containing protein [Acidobacteriota bacterium]